MYGDASRQGILRGVDSLANAVNAASIASLLLTTEAVITQIPEAHKNAATAGGGMGGMD